MRLGGKTEVFDVWPFMLAYSTWLYLHLECVFAQVPIKFMLTFFKYDGSLLNGLQIIPAWGDYFGHPAGQNLGLISASFYFRK
jgi:hypothetical protein